MDKRRKDIRNIAIIAHVDHGKTTLVDAMLRQGGVFRDNEVVQERAMDSNALEREKGITILAKNTAMFYKDHRINVVDTPGHADFGSEVERVLKMVDGVLLLIDAGEGVMPQTRFVLRKSLELHLQPIVVINKIDRPDARIHDIINKTFDLFVELKATDAQLDFPVLYASGRDGYALKDLKDKPVDLKPLFEAILKYVPGPLADMDGPLQMLVTLLDYSDYLGRLAIGRIFSGRIKEGQEVVLVKQNGELHRSKVSKLLGYRGLRREPWTDAQAGDIVCLAGVEELDVGETICDPQNPIAVVASKIDEPTISMNFMVNNSPLAGREGKFVTTRNIRERLQHEARINVGLRLVDTGEMDIFKVSGRGELHLAILIETMRREGFELAVSQPEVIYKEMEGEKLEPMEYLVVDLPEEFQGVVMENLGKRKSEIKTMEKEGVRIRIDAIIPSRTLIGFRSEFLTETRGNGVMHHVFHDYEFYKGDFIRRKTGVLIAQATGVSVAYALDSLQERGTLFVGPGAPLYEGMIIGETPRPQDLVVNPCKKKQLTNIRAASADEAIRLTPPVVMSLERALEFINDDELVEVTPKSIRLRKRILDENDRKRSKKKQ